VRARTTTRVELGFAAFAERFVRAYFGEIIEHPGHEPVEEDIEQLLAGALYDLEVHVDENRFLLRMRERNDPPEGWNFRITFRKSMGTWSILKFETPYHGNLLVNPYARYFCPKIARVMANAVHVDDT
jgi:hypothetical protein